MSTVDNVLIAVSLDGVDLGTWQDRADAEVSSPGVVKVAQPGGGFKAYASVRQDFGDIAVTRVYEQPIIDKWSWIASRVNVGRLAISETILDPDTRRATTQTRRWSGLLSSAVVNGTNTEDTGARRCALTCAVDTVA